MFLIKGIKCEEIQWEYICKRQSKRSSTQTWGAPWMRELAGTHEYEVTNIQFEVREAHLSSARHCRGGGHLERGTGGYHAKPSGRLWIPELFCFHLTESHSANHQWFLFEDTLEPDCPVYHYFTLLISIGIKFIFQASLVFLLQFQCCPPFRVLLGASQIPATTVSTLTWRFMFCPTFSPSVCFIRLANYRSCAFWLLNL